MSIVRRFPLSGWRKYKFAKKLVFNDSYITIYQKEFDRGLDQSDKNMGKKGIFVIPCIIILWFRVWIVL